MNLSKLPLFGLNVRCNSLRGEERFRAFRAFGKRVQALLSLGINPYGEGFGHHMCAPVYIFAQCISFLNCEPSPTAILRVELHPPQTVEDFRDLARRSFRPGLQARCSESARGQ